MAIVRCFQVVVFTRERAGEAVIKALSDSVASKTKAIATKKGHEGLKFKASNSNESWLIMAGKE